MAGTLSEIVAEEGATLPIGEVIARIGGEGAPAAGSAGAASASGTAGDNGGDGARAADAPAVSRGEPAAEAAPAAPPQPAPTSAPAAPASDGDGTRIKASPVAKRIAKDRGVELKALSGSGPGGRIVKADVERAIAAGPADSPALPASAPAPEAPAAAPAAPTAGAKEKPETAKGQVEVVELTKLQQTVARRMAESKATAPHFYLQAEIDMTQAVDGRRKLKEAAAEGESVPTFNDMIVKACAIALKEFPRANGAYRDGKIELYSRANVGVAVAAQDALVVPTVFDANQKGLRQISQETKALAQRVREGSITPPELSGGTFTVSNLGMYGITNFHAVINTPQAGILAVGELKPKPVVGEDGEIVARQLMGVTLACDHRILYGADGAQFLARVRALLEDPLGLAL
jgi:pyruvate dehydrogenase E2 component (dihydrolipoamide acetyltransferase)